MTRTYAGVLKIGKLYPSGKVGVDVHAVETSGARLVHQEFRAEVKKGGGGGAHQRVEGCSLRFRGLGCCGLRVSDGFKL